MAGPVKETGTGTAGFERPESPPLSGMVSETVIVCGPEGEEAPPRETGLKEKMGAIAEKASDKVSSAYEAGKSGVRSAYESTKGGVGEAAHRVREGAGSGAERLREAAASTGDHARDALCALRAAIQERPLVCLGVAFGAG